MIAIEDPATPFAGHPWTVAAASVSHDEAQSLVSAFGLPLPLAQLLLCRGFRDPDAVRTHLHPSALALHNPYALHGMRAAADRLLAALQAREPILVYGDYDVDGTVATVLLKTALERAAAALGHPADVRYHIPHRIREGYGLHEARIAEAAAEGVRLVISVDTGIRAFAAAAEAARLGLDLIVTDHHLPDSAGGLPPALAVLNPNQTGCCYPFKDLCGAGVAFKLAQALLEAVATTEPDRRRLREKTLPSFLKLLALATVADAVPLRGENRIIAALGLEALRQPAQTGLRSLMELAGIDLSRPLSATDVGFRLGPRINAAGRMDTASDVVEMFLARDPAVGRALAEKLHALNHDRRLSEARALAEIDARLAALEATGFPGCLVLDDTAASPWHRGVVGILASRVVERTGRPALVLTHENGEAHGSGRSVAGFHLLDALTAAHGASADPLFLRFGGHAHAAGFALPSARVPKLRERLESYTAGFDMQALAPQLICEVELSLPELNDHFFAAYDRLGPWGHGNHEPIFVARRLCLAADPRLLKERHLLLQVRPHAGEGRAWKAVGWSRRVDWVARARTEALSLRSCFDLAFRLRRNWHPDFGGWELEIEDLHIHPPAAAQSAPSQ